MQSLVHVKLFLLHACLFLWTENARSDFYLFIRCICLPILGNRIFGSTHQQKQNKQKEKRKNLYK